MRTQLFCSQNWWSSLTVVWTGFGDFDENLIEKSGILPDKTNFRSTSDHRISADSYPLVTRRYLRKSAWSNSFISGDYPRSRPQHHSIPPRWSYSILGYKKNNLLLIFTQLWTFVAPPTLRVTSPGWYAMMLRPTAWIIPGNERIRSSAFSQVPSRHQRIRVGGATKVRSWEKISFIG